MSKYTFNQRKTDRTVFFKNLPIQKLVKTSSVVRMRLKESGLKPVVWFKTVLHFRIVKIQYGKREGRG